MTNVARKYKQAQLSDLDPTISPALHGLVKEYVTDLAEMWEKRKGLLLVGKPGIGKTMGLSVILNAAKAAGFSTRFVTLAGYQRGLMKVMRLREDQKAATDYQDKEDLFDEYRAMQVEGEKLLNTYQFLAVDDVGKEHGTSTRFIEDEFDYLLRHRGHKGLVTLMTSNIPLTKWSDTYSESMRSYIHEICFVVEVDGTDARRGVI